MPDLPVIGQDSRITAKQLEKARQMVVHWSREVSRLTKQMERERAITKCERSREVGPRLDGKSSGGKPSGELR